MSQSAPNPYSNSDFLYGLSYSREHAAMVMRIAILILIFINPVFIIFISREWLFYVKREGFIHFIHRELPFRLIFSFTFG